jgi:hypothetical protein
MTQGLMITNCFYEKAHNILVMGRACFLRVPESEANDLNFLLCRCTETGYASRLSNNEIKPMKHIEPNSAMKNRAPNNPINQTCWNKEEQGAGADVYPGPANTQEESSASAGIQTELR